MVAPQHVGPTDVPDDVAQGRDVAVYRLSRGALTLGSGSGSMRGFLRQMRRYQPSEIVLVAPEFSEHGLNTAAHVVLGAIYDAGGWAGTLHKCAVREQQWCRVGMPMDIRVTKTAPQAA